MGRHTHRGAQGKEDFAHCTVTQEDNMHCEMELVPGKDLREGPDLGSGLRKGGLQLSRPRY